MLELSAERVAQIGYDAFVAGRCIGELAERGALAKPIQQQLANELGPHAMKIMGLIEGVH
jgi:hypothetical protein